MVAFGLVDFKYVFSKGAPSGREIHRHIQPACACSLIKFHGNVWFKLSYSPDSLGAMASYVPWTFRSEEILPEVILPIVDSEDDSEDVDVTEQDNEEYYEEFLPADFELVDPEHPFDGETELALVDDGEFELVDVENPFGEVSGRRSPWWQSIF